MRNTHCERESAALQALAVGSWPEDLRAHVARCQRCSDAVLVAQAMSEAADFAAAEPLPDSGRIWRAAQRRARQLAVERAMWPIRLATRVAFVACGVGAVAGTVWMWPTVEAQVTAVAGWFSHRTAIDTGQILTAVVGFASLAAFVAVFALFESWAKE